MKISTKVVGVEQAYAKLKRTAEFRYTRKAVDKAGEDMQRKLREYPAERHGPAILSKDPDKRKRQLRWIFWAKKAGLIPYRRTRTLARGWSYNYRSSRETMTATLENAVPYAKWVQLEGHQAMYHRITGWRTNEQIAKDMTGPTVRTIFAGVEADVNNS